MIVTGAIGAIIFGAAGYYGADWLADWIDDNSVKELQKDVNFVEGMRERSIELIVGKDETQYEFCNRALMWAAIQAQKEMHKTGDKFLPNTFANKFFPIDKPISEQKKFELSWVDSPKLDKNSDGIVNPSEWKAEQGTKFTYQLNDDEVNELIRMLFGLSR